MNMKGIVKADLELMKRLRFLVKKYPTVNDFMRSITSKKPASDVVIVLYLLFALGLWDIGRKHFWAVSLNICVVHCARLLIEAKRPVEYDVTLQPIADIGADSYGFPSLESHMSIVILGHLCLHYSLFLLIPLSTIIIILIGFSRVYAMSRFPHQIVGSWITGALGLYLGLHCCQILSLHMMHSKNHICCVIAVLALFLCTAALSAENNDSRVMFVPKTEFVKVISAIISPASVETDRSKESVDGQGLLNQSAGIEEDISGKRNRVKRDSFFHLQKSLENRSQILEDYTITNRLRLSSSRYSSHTNIRSSYSAEVSEHEYGA